jgi:hypothetical protein
VARSDLSHRRRPVAGIQHVHIRPHQGYCGAGRGTGRQVLQAECRDHVHRGSAEDRKRCRGSFALAFRNAFVVERQASRNHEPSHPIQVWYVTATREQSGRQTADTPFDPVGVTGTNRKVFGSRLGDDKSSVFENVLIIADSAKLAGHDIGTVSDYLAVLALAQVDQVAGCAALPSVTDAFSQCTGETAANSITDTDMEYLKALYATSPNVPGSTSRADIARRMSEGLTAK